MLDNWQKLVLSSVLRENLNLVQLKSCYQTERETPLSIYVGMSRISLSVYLGHLTCSREVWFPDAHFSSMDGRRIMTVILLESLQGIQLHNKKK